MHLDEQKPIPVEMTSADEPKQTPEERMTDDKVKPIPMERTSTGETKLTPVEKESTNEPKVSPVERTSDDPEIETTIPTNKTTTTIRAKQTTEPSGTKSADKADEGTYPSTESNLTELPISTIPTTSIVTTSLHPARRRRQLTKEEASLQFVYGPTEAPVSGRRQMLVEHPEISFRKTRTQMVRDAFILKRIKMVSYEQERLKKAKNEWENNRVAEPIKARPVALGVYSEPDNDVRLNRASQFRYMYNRKLPGSTVYFVKGNQMWKPPFVVPNASKCYSHHLDEALIDIGQLMKIKNNYMLRPEDRFDEFKPKREDRHWKDF